jgi:DNA ligase-1
MLNPGESTQVQGSSSKPYVVKNVDGRIWSCECMSWKTCPGQVNTKTCKHIRQVHGEALELARIGQPVAAPVAAKVTTGQGNATTGQSPCACHAGNSCTVAHDPATCLCTLCTTAEVGSSRENIEASEEASLGRKLRQDEKAKLFGPPVLLANSFNEEGDMDPTGWWWSEKLDGVRAYWNGSKFITRQGHTYDAPEWFTRGFPNHPLDGELWMGRRMFQKTISVVKSGPSERWRQVCYMVFDVPQLKGEFEIRIAEAEVIAKTIGTPWIKAHQHGIILSRKFLADKLHEIEAAGGEGLMLRKPKSLYVAGRSSTLLKVKPFKDAEAVIIGHKPGQGRHKGVLGGLEVRLPDGKTFNVGSGLTDAQRRNPPTIGKTITYRYTDLTDDGLPKCASFVAIRDYE